MVQFVFEKKTFRGRFLETEISAYKTVISLSKSKQSYVFPPYGLSPLGSFGPNLFIKFWARRRAIKSQLGILLMLGLMSPNMEHITRTVQLGNRNQILSSSHGYGILA